MSGLLKVVMVICIVLSISGSLVVSAADDLTQISLSVATTFPMPEGGYILVPAAAYRVEATKNSHLKLVPTEGADAIVVACEKIKHEEPLEQVTALIAEDEQNDIHILLIGIDGEGYEAIGFKGEVMSRGAKRKTKPLSVSTRTEIIKSGRTNITKPIISSEPVSKSTSLSEEPIPGSNVIDNSVSLEISGVGLISSALIVQGPGLVIERVEVYGAAGRPDDQPGMVSEMPIIFEYKGSNEAGLQTWYDNAHNPQINQTRSVSMVVKNSNNTESFRWNLYEMYPEMISSGNDGSKLYELRSMIKPETSSNPRNDTVYELIGTFEHENSFNPNTDNHRVEISGIMVGAYPQVEIDQANRKITLTFDYMESNEVYDWVRSFFRGDTTKRSMSVISEQPPGSGAETSRTNYFGVFPLRYQMISGFAQDIKTKQQIVLSYDFSE